MGLSSIMVVSRDANLRRRRPRALNAAAVLYQVLPEAFAHDADRLARFQREANTLTSLNHPNLAAI
jgi:hypothetical protein